MIPIRMNGRDSEVAPGTTLAALVESLGKDPRTVAIEKNGEIVPRRLFDSTTLAAGDALEVVQFVQGG